jgi:hypothetical protein
MEQSLCAMVAQLAKKVPILMELEGCCRVYESQPLAPCRNRGTPFHIMAPCFLKFRVNISSTPLSLEIGLCT